MRSKLLLITFSLSFILPFFLFGQNPSTTDNKTETTSSQEVEKRSSQDEGDVSENEQKKDVVVEDVIIEEGSEEDIIEEEDISEDVVTEEDIIEEVPKEEVVKEKDVEEKALEKEESKEEVVTEEKPEEKVVTEEDVVEEDIVGEISEDEKLTEETAIEEKKIDTVESSPVLLEEGTAKEIEESVKVEKSAEEEKDTVSKEVAVEEEDMDIILEEDEDLLIVDDEEELLIEEEPVETTVVEEVPIKEGEDTITAKVIPPEETGEQPQREEAPVSPEVVETEEDVAAEEEVATSAMPSKGKSSKRMKIERARSINFAGNLKEYRSPKKAMFMSLLLPGLGQAYTKKYWKTALFGVIEASLIGFAVKNAIDGRDKLEDARNFADEHYYVQDFFKFYEDFIVFVSPESIDVDVEIVFGDSLNSYKKTFTGITNKSHDIDARKDFDKLIGDDESPFVQGWDDCEPSFSSTGYDISDPSNTYLYKYFTDDTLWVISRYDKIDSTLVHDGIYGYSKNQGIYSDMIRRSNRFYDISRYLIFFLVANHVASAVDAFISARAFNDKLLHKESLWQRINIDHQVAFARDGFHSRLGIQVRF